MIYREDPVSEIVALEHYGIPGMKWGVKKSERSDAISGFRNWRIKRKDNRLVKRDLARESGKRRSLNKDLKIEGKIAKLERKNDARWDKKTGKARIQKKLVKQAYKNAEDINPNLTDNLPSRFHFIKRNRALTARVDKIRRQAYTIAADEYGANFSGTKRIEVLVAGARREPVFAITNNGIEKTFGPVSAQTQKTIGSGGIRRDRKARLDGTIR